MDSVVWSQDTTILLGGCSAEHLSTFQSAPSNPDVTGSSGTLHRPAEDVNSVPGHNNGGEAASSFLHSSPLETDAPGRVSSARGHPEGYDLIKSRQAKRARVENIIRGMTGSPGVFERTDYVQGQEKIQEPALPQDLMGERRSVGVGQTRTRRQAESQQQLRRLREKFYRKHETGGNGRERHTTWQPLPSSPFDTFPDSLIEFDDGFGRTTKLQSGPERMKLMADVLKYELSRAVSMSVDSVFKSMPLLQTSPTHEGEQTDVLLHSPMCEDEKTGLSPCGNEMAQIQHAALDIQTEALSLVVQKPRHETSDKFALQSNWKVPPEPALSFSQDYSRMNPSGTKLNADMRWFQEANSEVERAKFEMFNPHWTPVKVRSKAKSRSVRSSHSPTVSENLSFPQVKIESGTLVKNNLYVFNEGLTTRHLKKAKLMFFYTRYPSSAVLRMCFHDVKFTRCITSQLIKWFSNFREFFYIQIEKFARHALVGGVSDVRALTVERESELFRALNIHYNKASDFQVPDRFLEVAEITLREFYISISMGKDRDPSWKKAIYKVICKLDSDVPDQFSSHHTRSYLVN